MYHLALTGSYHTLEVGLFKNNICLEQVIEPHRKMSSTLVPHLDELLSAHQLTLSDISFITVNHGPGSFTSLRVLLATLHGITFTKQIPLVAVNGLEALAHHAHQTHPDHTIVSLLNAYSGDVHLAAYHHGSTLIEPQCLSINKAIETIINLNKPPYYFTGNGVQAYRSTIQEAGFSLPEKCVAEAPLSSFAQIGLARFEKDQKSFFVMPLYLKIHTYTPKYSTS